MDLFLGIDGGGTKTSCLVGNDKSVLGSGSAGPSNILRVGEAEARKCLVDAVQQACNSTGTRPAQITRTCVGIAGGARPAIAEKVRAILTDTISGDIEIVGDMVIALHAAFGAGPGIVVIAGTGSIAFGRNLEGETARAGGWGPTVSDEGSGYWIGREAVASALRNADMNPELTSPLLRAIMTAWSVENRDALVLAANAALPANFAALFPAVVAAASSDDLAADTLSRAGRELAALVKMIVTRLFPNDESVPVAMSGGVFRNSELVRNVFYNELTRECPAAEIRSEISDPALGALELARRPNDGNRIS